MGNGLHLSALARDMPLAGSQRVSQPALPLRMSCRAITGSLRHHVPSVIMVGMNSSQITARTITVTPASTASAGSEVVVQLSASPDPRWQACFHFVVQGRDGFFLQGRPVFDNASFHGVLQAGQAEAFRQDCRICWYRPACSRVPRLTRTRRDKLAASAVGSAQRVLFGGGYLATSPK
ncbi:hypothetical protein XPN_0087 [Xanthomonas arboricola pv. pruni MAFF 301427]|nr:hypothetical protein XPN_0087 [Xanthomonas arboricola pv. pruni MAFF 301427]